MTFLYRFQQLCQAAEQAHNLTGQSVNATSECATHDINMVCNPDMSIPGGVQGKCGCRPDMKWNNEAKECQVCTLVSQFAHKFLPSVYPTHPFFMALKIFMDVDCSAITYETPPSTAVLSAVEKAKAELASVASNLTQETLERWERV